jgi:hypothetical protein
VQSGSLAGTSGGGIVTPSSPNDWVAGGSNDRPAAFGGARQPGRYGFGALPGSFSASYLASGDGSSTALSYAGDLIYASVDTVILLGYPETNGDVAAAARTLRDRTLARRSAAAWVPGTPGRKSSCSGAYVSGVAATDGGILESQGEMICHGK